MAYQFNNDKKRLEVNKDLQLRVKTCINLKMFYYLSANIPITAQIKHNIFKVDSKELSLPVNNN